MKKIMSIVILGLLLTSASGFIIMQSSAQQSGLNNFGTHIVLGEFGTATWCGFCKYAHGALKEIYKNDWYDFYYVSLVCDKNTHSYYRAINQLGLTGYPTVYWDGSYTQNVGAGSVPSAIAAYNVSINNCATRTVANIDLTISVTWLGGTSMSITVTVTNNQATIYNGYLRCYVTEIASSMGWYDTAGDLYTFPFLDYAFDQTITAAASGGVWSNTVTWNGATHNDGYGHAFTSITQDNTFIIASVFSSTSPYYVDETAGYRLGSNRPPNTPSSPSPSNGQTNVAVTPTLTWVGTDPDWFDDLYFDVYFEKDDSTPDVLVSDDQTSTSYQPGTLDMVSDYYWQIIAHDEYGLTVSGPIWHFTTRGNSPPNAPSNPSPMNGATNVPINPTLTWTCTDPDGDKMYYDVYFDAENPNPTTQVSINQTGKTYQPSQLEYNTTYYWKIVTEDIFGATTEGPIWSFTTEEGGTNYPPTTPTIGGKIFVRPNQQYDYAISSTDPEEEQIFYRIYWGDNITEWMGPYPSGEAVIFSHSWPEPMTPYLMIVYAKDINGNHCIKNGQFPIICPRDYKSNIFVKLLNRLIENHPIFALLLKIISRVLFNGNLPYN